MPMEDLFRLVRVRPSRGCSSATTSPSATPADRADLAARAAVPGAAGLRLGGGRGRRRARRHRPDLQPADGARDPDRVRAAAAGRAHDAAAAPGTDGVQKMSKSSATTIGITEPPEEMYGKTLSIPDAALAQWYDAAARARAPPAGVGAARRQARARARARGRASTARAAAAAAEAAFDRVFVARELPEDDAEEAAFAAGERRRPPAGADRRRCSAARGRTRGGRSPRAA